jgi:hypothetical protein
MFLLSLKNVGFIYFVFTGRYDLPLSLQCGFFPARKLQDVRSDQIGAYFSFQAWIKSFIRFDSVGLFCSMETAMRINVTRIGAIIGDDQSEFIR